MAATTPNAYVTTRRRFALSIIAASALGAGAGAASAIFWAQNSRSFERLMKARRGAARVALVHRVAPPDGYQTRVSFGDSIMRLVAAGAISPEKFGRLYAKRGGLPEWIERLFAEPSVEPIKFGFKTAPYLLNLLWPLGLSTKTGFNSTSPLNGENLEKFASTGGWRLGEAANGSVYFNQLEAIRLDGVQENVVLGVAGNVYRPCCDNSTFFQDCNHGSALLGLLELAASQGASPDELYELALNANVFWYPTKYVDLAVYFEQIEDQPWQAADPKTILGKRYSSLSGWNRNVRGALIKADLLPRQTSRGAAGCGV
jgi:hypothetical protein